MNIKALAHICISSKDLDKTRVFYCDGLGLKKVFDFKKKGETSGFYLEVSKGNYLEFFKDATDYADNSSLRHICLETPNIKALRTHLTAKGISCTESKLGGDGSWQFWIKDPNGVNIEFHEYTAKSSQKTGKPVEINW
jgi:catechol 2,3-dioxygenase-like lactoylglutathione lyase family enzyme